MEIIVCTVILCTCVFLILSLVPTSMVAFRKAERLQVATLYATEVLNATAANQNLAVIPGVKKTVTLNGQDYDVTLDVSPTDDNDAVSCRYQLSVTVGWHDQPTPVQLVTLENSMR